MEMVIKRTQVGGGRYVGEFYMNIQLFSFTM